MQNTYMSYNLTEKQKAAARWLVAEMTAKRLNEDFYVLINNKGTMIADYNGKVPPILVGTLDALADAKLLIVISRPKRTETKYVATGKLYKAVESDFAEPKTPTTVINDLSKAQFAGGFAATVQGNQVGGSINNRASETPSLAEVATEIRILLETIKASAPNAIESVRRLTEINLGLIERLEQIEVARERDRILELQQAQLVPTTQWGQNRKYILNLENQGKATAEMVHVKADGVSFGKITQICAGGYRNYDLGTSHYQSKDAKEIHVEWIDRTGRRTLKMNLEWIS